ncbi:MAG TPA: hypothetical protein P5026_01775 [Kiritimatiellia bacterium]|nr:hypothetical protein [Kiritimatiellia bacterium]HRU70540.1 hypothetical protein [Kiritimatiellia bacterium]
MAARRRFDSNSASVALEITGTPAPADPAGAADYAKKHCASNSREEHAGGWLPSSRSGFGSSGRVGSYGSAGEGQAPACPDRLAAVPPLPARSS